MYKRVGVVGTLTLGSLALMGVWPVKAVDFRSNRTDGIQYRGQSINQQSSNQAYNLFDIISDPSAASYGLYWKGALRADTLPYVDPREQDAVRAWDQWVTDLGVLSAVGQRSTYTPNIPQGWSPIVIDLDRTGAVADHFLVNVSFEPSNGAVSPAADPREQVITAYWPETANGLGNLSSQVPPNRLEPLSDAINGNRIWRLKTRELAPIKNHPNFGNSVGVVTQPPIYSFIDGHHLLYLVIGRGEHNDPAQVVCLRIPPPLGTGAAPQVPNPGNYGDYWDPDQPDKPSDPGGNGMVVWSYEVKARSGSGVTPVAGISFADLGDVGQPRPNLFITTKDGQLICINARPLDKADVAQDGDPKGGEERWKWMTNGAASPPMEFAYGMAPAACRVPLTGAYRSQTLTNAISKHNVDEWMVFVADSWGAFRAFDASGKPDSATKPTQYTPRLRWQDAVWELDPMTMAYIQRQRPSPVAGEFERFKVPPVVYQGGTPMTTSTGVPVGPLDVGYDDEVIFASERGRLYVFDAIGKLRVSGGADDGQPLFEATNNPPVESGVNMRWQWPESDTTLAATAGGEEPRVWPRELSDITAGVNTLPRVFGNEISVNSSFYLRSALSTSLGANANPNSGTPNLDLGDDLIFVPYIQDVTAAEQALRPSEFDATKRYFYEYVGSLKPYPFVQAERPIENLVSARITWTDPATMAVQTIYVGKDSNVPAANQIPIDRVLRVGTVKSNGITVTQAPSAAGANASITALQDDTAYFVSQSFYYPQTGQYVSIPFGPAYNTQVTLTYESLDAAGNPQSHTDAPAALPSCYRRDRLNAGDSAATPIILRTKASLSVNRGRLEQRSIQNGVVYDEYPAQVDLAAFDTYDQRQPSMFAAGSANAGGLLLAPSWYRGRIVALNNVLQPLTVLPGFHDTRYGSGNVLAPPFDGDPGPFVTLTPENLRDEFSYMDIGASVTEVDGWLYLTYQNGHTRAWSNQAGGAPGTDGPNSPIFTQPPSPNFGNRVRAPIIRLLDNVPANTTPSVTDIRNNVYPYRDVTRTGDGALLLEYGEDVHILVDFGTFPLITDLVDNSDSSRNPNEPDPNGRFLDSRLIDPQNVVQAQLLSSIGAIGQLAAPARGVPVYWDRPNNGGNGRCYALITLNTGYPSGTNPLTPGTSVLREKQAGQFQANEALYYLQVTQSGVQWLWPHSDPQDSQGNTFQTGIAPAGVTIGQYPSYESEAIRQADPSNYTRPDPRRIHYWTIEPNQTGNPNRFPRTAGGTAANPNWNWTKPETREYAPLVSYNNPLVLYYDPIPDYLGLPNATGVQGMYDGGNPVNALPLDPGSPSTVNPGPPGPGTGTQIQFRERFTSVTDQGRKNGDAYTTSIVEGSRSGTGVPVIPTLGMGLVGSGTPQAKQLLFGEHGRTTPASSDLIPGLAQLRVGDRSHMGLRGRNLAIRVQRAPLTKMGMGAAFGGVTNPGYPAGAPLGSVQQNVNVWDDGPDGLYPSIPESRMVVSKTGTTVDLASGSVAIPGRALSGSNPGGALPRVDQLESLTVQVDIPTYTPDDIYSTRWRTATQRGSAPNAVGTTVNGVAGSMFNPFWPGNAILGLNPMSHWDRSEARATIAPGSTTTIQAPEPDPNPPAGHDPLQDDRLRRVIVFVDSDNDGKLDLEPNRREAYRTFAVQVGVQPDMKLETQTTVVDFGALHHGKKQPGLGTGAAEIREYQRMQQLANSTSGVDKSVASFYNQWWRKIVLVNRGNVNLAYVKPEILYTEANATSRIRALPSEGNDWFRALPLVNTTSAAALADPLQIFIRTSFDDQFLPDTSLAYAGNDRGLWVQKAAVGSGLPGAIAYADNLIDTQSAPRGQALYRDPSLAANNWQNARDFWMTLNLPTGAPLGQYGGTMTFYNDRMVTFASNLASPVGYSYLEATVGRNGLLDRQVGGEPIEPMIDPPIQVKARVTETLVQGRYQYAPATPGNPTGTHIQDRPDRRIMPAAALAVDPGGGNTRLRLVYASNRAGITSTRPQPVMYDLWGTELLLNNSNGLFPFDELPDDRTPWSAWPGFTNPAAEFSLFSNMSTFLTQSPPAVGAITKPSLVHDLDGNGILAWSDRLSTLGSFALQGTNERHRVVYQGVQGNTFGPFVLNPGGVAPDMRVERNGVRMIPTPSSPSEWFAFYDMGTGPRHSLGYTWTATPDNNNSWRTEHTIPTSRSFSGIRDPHAFMTEAGATGLPDPLTWIAYAGATQRRGLTDVYLGRYLTNALKSPGQKGAVDPLGKAMDYGLTSFPRVTQGLLQANPTRTVYSADGIDWLANPANDIKIYLVRPDKTSGPGSAATPLPLLGVPPNDSPSPTGERVAPLDPNLVNGAPMALRTALQQVRVIADPAAGTIRFTIDTRMLARMLVSTPTMTADSPDPIILADYTPQTMRLTLGDVSAHDPVVVPVLSDSVAGNVYDASWYLQHIDGTKWAQETPVAGIADRLWVFWRRTAGASAGSPSCYYKVLRPGIRVRAGAIGGIVDSSGNPTLTPSVRPEEVNPQTGQLFYPAVREGQLIQVQYRTPQGTTITESHRVTWQDETGERPVPMESAVNEGSLDAFAVYEMGQMTTFGQTAPAAVRKMDRIWLFWSSTRGTGGDIYSATLAPRIGLEVAVSGSATTFYPYASFRGFSSTTKSTRGRTPLTVNAAVYNRRRPFVLPPIVRRGPLVPMRAPRAVPRRAGS